MLRIKYLLSLVSLITLLSCSTTETQLIQTGFLDQTEEGLPHLTYGVFVNYENPYFPKAQFDIEIPHSSLIFKKLGIDAFKAEAELTIWIRQTKSVNAVAMKLYHQRIEITIQDYKSTKSEELYSIQELIPVEAGEYELLFEFEDLNTKKTTTKYGLLKVEDARGSSFTVSEIQLTGLIDGNTKRKPLLTYYINESIRDIDGRVHLVFKQNRVPAQVEAYLLRFKADSLSAKLPFYFNESRLGLQYMGIDYSNPDTIRLGYNQSQDKLGTVELHVEVPKLARGNYRLVVNGVAQDSVTKVYRAREFAIRSESFPKVNEIDELLNPLEYLTSDDEMNEIKKAKTVLEKRIAFDSFWKNINENPVTSSMLMKTYYSRVEEANVRYSTFKEGWKTDKGMIYIIFGNPELVENTIDGELWKYWNVSNQYAIQFLFRKVRGYQFELPFNHAILERNLNYDRIYREAIDRWRSGLVLE